MNESLSQEERGDWITKIRTITPRGSVRIPIAEGFLFTNVHRGQMVMDGDVVYWVEDDGLRYVPDLAHPEWPIASATE